ncbi:MAG: sporulation protein [Clostridiales bacterium]|jgi:uncharacterized spore protein YtfJ|nr:sporulation protein [Clostridiales bacterium]
MGADLNENMDVLFGRIENFVSSKTVVGEPIHIGGVILLPLVDVTFGIAAGAFDKKENGAEKDNNEAGGATGKITPSAVVVVQNGNVQLVNIKNQDSLNKLIDMIPGALSKLNFGPFKNKKESAEEETDDSVEVIKTETVVEITPEETEED